MRREKKSREKEREKKNQERKRDFHHSDTRHIIRPVTNKEPGTERVSSIGASVVKLQ